jgi:hypothetical protein
MLYNKELKKVQSNSDCITCKYFDKNKKKCNGIGKNCFEYDLKTKTAIDPITKLPIKIN